MQSTADITNVTLIKQRNMSSTLYVGAGEEPGDGARDSIC